MPRTHKWPASPIADELQAADVIVSRRTVTGNLAALGLNHRSIDRHRPGRPAQSGSSPGAWRGISAST
jgi:hypothetical protein